MRYTVRSNSLGKICLNESEPVASALQNVAVILTTKQGSVPLYRDFGLPMKFVDKPITVAKSMIYAEVWEAVEKFEPRVEVLGVSFEENPDALGRLIISVEVNVKDD